MKNVTKSSNRHVTFSFRRSHVFELLHAAMRWRCPCHPSRVEIHNLRAMLLTHKKLDGQGDRVGGMKQVHGNRFSYRSVDSRITRVILTTSFTQPMKKTNTMSGYKTLNISGIGNFVNIQVKVNKATGGVPNVSPPSRILHPP